MQREQAREQFLTDAELIALFKALDVEPSQTAACAIALLAATGARRGEVLGARWERVDLDRRILTVPAASSKSGRTRYIPLSDAAIRILQRVPRCDSPWVFPGTDPRKPISDLKKVWVRVKERQSGVTVRRADDLIAAFQCLSHEEELAAFRCVEGVAVSHASDGWWLLFSPDDYFQSGAEPPVRNEQLDASGEQC
jgi:site-specific recombinase XerD